MSSKQIQKVFTWLLQNQVSNGTDLVGEVHDGYFCLKVWGNFDGATVTIQVLAEDEITWIPCYTFNSEGVQFGRVGSANERFRAVLTGAGGLTNVSCTVTK